MFKHFRPPLHTQPIQIGLWSGVPHLTRFLFSLFLSFAVDSLMSSGMYSRTCVRKISTNICTVVQAALIVALVYSGCDQLLVNGFLLLAMTVSGASTSGPLSIMVDLSPNFASEYRPVVSVYRVGRRPTVVLLSA